MTKFLAAQPASGRPLCNNSLASKSNVFLDDSSLRFYLFAAKNSSRGNVFNSYYICKITLGYEICGTSLAFMR